MHRHLSATLIAPVLFATTASLAQAESITLIDVPVGLVDGVIDRELREVSFFDDFSFEPPRELSFRTDTSVENVTVRQEENTLNITASYGRGVSKIEQRGPITRVDSFGDSDTASSGVFIFRLDTAASFRLRGTQNGSGSRAVFSLERQESGSIPARNVFEMSESGSSLVGSVGTVGGGSASLFNGFLAVPGEDDLFSGSELQRGSDILADSDPLIDSVDFTGISGTLEAGVYVLTADVVEPNAGPRGNASSSVDVSLTVTAIESSPPDVVPTPSALLAGGLGMLALATRRRRD